VPFYEQQGFIVEGEEFIEADMPHLLMRRRLG
jgi:predicted GNAT family N-acyltransferase